MSGNIKIPSLDSVYFVTDFGAVGDGVLDNTDAFNRALKTAGENGGGIVFVPAGNFLFKGHITIPVAVTLQGIYSYAPSHQGRINENLPKPGESGSVLMPTADKGTEDGEAFVILNHNASLKGVSIFYPEQTDEQEPYKYPWTISLRGRNCAVIDVDLLNAYNGIDAGKYDCPRHYISRVYGQPLRRGIYIDQIHDIGRIENVHFNPWWSCSKTICDFMVEHGEAFLIGRCDWQYMTNCFAIFYKVGFLFDDFGNGTPNVLLTQCGHDEAPMTVVINNSQIHAGISFNNCQMMGELYVNESNKGPVKFNNCGFWGTIHGRLGQTGSASLINLNGKGHITINSCQFYGWDIDPDRKGSPCINVNCDSSIISSCSFMRVKDKHITVGENAKKCIILGNMFCGNIVIEKSKDGVVEEGFNATI